MLHGEGLEEAALAVARRAVQEVYPLILERPLQIPLLPEEEIRHVVEELQLLVVAEEDAPHAPGRALHLGPT